MLQSCSEPKQEPLKIAYTDWIGDYPLILAKEKGYFKDAVHIHEIANSSESLRLFKNNLIDGMTATMDEALDLYIKNKDISIILVTDHSKGSDVIVANPDIRSLKALKGKRIGYESSAVGALMLAMVLQNAELSLDDITPVNVPYHEHEQAYDKGEVDAVITYDPNKSNLEKSGAVLLFDSSKIPYTILDVLIVRRSLVDKKDKRLKTLTQGWFNAVDLIHNKPSAIPVIFNYKPSELSDMFEGVELLDRADNLELFQNSKLIGITENIFNIMTEHELISVNELDIPSLLDDRCIREPFE